MDKYSPKHSNNNEKQGTLLNNILVDIVPDNSYGEFYFLLYSIFEIFVMFQTCVILSSGVVFDWVGMGCSKTDATSLTLQCLNKNAYRDDLHNFGYEL